MALELERTKEKPIRHTVTAIAMVDIVRLLDGTYVRQLAQPADRQTPMHEAVVNHQIRDTKDARTDADTKHDLTHDADGPDATIQNERDGERRVQGTEHVVRFEVSVSADVVALMHEPQPLMPDAAVQQGCPQVHEHSDDQRGRYPDERAHV